MARLTLEAVPLVFLNWAKRTLFRLVFVNIPMAAIRVLVAASLLSPRSRKVWLNWVARGRAFIFVRYDMVIEWFRGYFGAHAFFAFLLSLVVTALVFLLTFAYVGLGLLYWGPLGAVWAWLMAGVTQFIHSTLHTFPFLGRCFSVAQWYWEQYVKQRYPLLYVWHRRASRRVMRGAIRSRLVRTRAQERVRQRIVARKRELALVTRARLVSSRGMGMPWEDRTWQGRDFSRLMELSTSCAYDRMYARSLGAILKPSFIEGARACGRPTK